MSYRSGINFKKEMHRLMKHSKRPMFTYRVPHEGYEFSPSYKHKENSMFSSHTKSVISSFMNKNSKIIASAAIGILGAAAIGMSMQKTPKKKNWVSIIGRMM